MLDLAKKLRVARISKGYNLRQVAKITNFSLWSLFWWEHNKKLPSFAQLTWLAELYKRPIEFFLGFTREEYLRSRMLWWSRPSTKSEIKQEIY